MGQDLDLDDDWESAPPPVTAVAVRIEEAAVEAIRELAGAEGLLPAELMRRWVLQRLDAELHPPEPEPDPPPAPPAPVKKRAATRKKAPAKKAAARKKA